MLIGVLVHIVEELDSLPKPNIPVRWLVDSVVPHLELTERRVI